MMIFSFEKVALPGEHPFDFFLGAITGTIWFVCLQKCGFRVVNCWVFQARDMGPSSARG